MYPCWPAPPAPAQLRSEVRKQVSFSLEHFIITNVDIKFKQIKVAIEHLEVVTVVVAVLLAKEGLLYNKNYDKTF